MARPRGDPRRVVACRCPTRTATEAVRLQRDVRPLLSSDGRLETTTGVAQVRRSIFGPRARSEGAASEACGCACGTDRHLLFRSRREHSLSIRRRRTCDVAAVPRRSPRSARARTTGRLPAGSTVSSSAIGLRQNYPRPTGSRLRPDCAARNDVAWARARLAATSGLLAASASASTATPGEGVGHFDWRDAGGRTRFS